MTVEGDKRLAQLDLLAACGDVVIQGFLVAGLVEASEIVRLIRGTRERLALLLDAAQPERANPLEDDFTSSVRMLRQNRR